MNFTLSCRLLLAAVVLATLAGCGGGLTVARVNSAQRKPNNVWVFFTVDKGRKDPVAGLTADDFAIYEDNELVSKFERWQSPHAWTRTPLTGNWARSAAMLSAAPR